jgi:signal peptidase
MTANTDKIKRLKRAKRIGSIVWTILFTLLVLLIFSIISAKYKGEVPSIFGLSIIKVTTGSMEDKIPTGSYILIVKTPADKIKKDNIICFYSDDPEIKGYLNTHRVVKDPIITENGIEFVTKGDAALEEDEYTAKGDKLVGKYLMNLDFMKTLMKITEPKNMFILVIVINIGLAAMFITTTMISKKEADEDSSDR